MLSTTSPSPLIAALLHHYDQLVDHVRRHVARFGGDGSSAPDVVHDVCIQLIETPPAQPVHTPLAFLRSVTSRRAIDRHRVEAARSAWVQSVDDPAADVPDLRAVDPAQALAARQQLQRLVRAIEQLPPRCREVFVLHKVHELPQADVAEHLGISLKTVEKHLRLGVAACRDMLEWGT